jgi:long-chain acyl-CoA synthetase
VASSPTPCGQHAKLTDMITKQGRSGQTLPFDMSGVVRTDDGVLRYSALAPSLLDMFRSSVDRHPDRECIVVLGGERVTYRQLWDRSARVAGGLRAAGVQAGDRVANRHGNGLEWCLGFWGTLMAGAVVVPVNTRFSESEVSYVVTDAGADVVLVPDSPLPDGEPHVAADAGHKTVAALMYTSGTTGFPKGAMVTHENFLSNIETCIRAMHIAPDVDVRNLISVPLFHATGCNSQLLPTIRLGARR